MITTVTTQLTQPSEPYTGGGLPKGWIMVVIGTALYVLPTLLAFKRDSTRKWKVAVINVLLGWTVIGWVVALVLTYAYEPPPPGEADVEHIPGQ
jgi:riboflavin transporter FmnP